MNIKRITVAALIGAGLSVSGAALGAALAQGTAHTTPVVRHSVAAITKKAVKPARCATAAPTSAVGYTKMFAAINPAQWGAADTSVSVPLADGRSVWVYADTFSAGRFMHSTAIVQDKGCLHVSHGGAQLLPNDDAKHIYWPVSAKISGGNVLVTAEATTLIGTGAWDFRYGGHMRTALVTVNAAGDVTFARWVSAVRTAAPNAGPMYRFDSNPHHFGYARHTHPEAHLASGRTLVTTCQNWDDGTMHAFADYRPIFSER